MADEDVTKRKSSNNNPFGHGDYSLEIMKKKSLLKKTWSNLYIKSIQSKLLGRCALQTTLIEQYKKNFGEHYINKKSGNVMRVSSILKKKQEKKKKKKTKFDVEERDC